MKAISFIALLLLGACAIKKKPHSIEAGIESLSWQMRQCFIGSDSYKGTKHIETGVIRASFTVTKEGKIDDEKIFDTTFKDPNLNACILGLIRTLSFDPQINGPVFVVTKPLNIYSDVR